MPIRGGETASPPEPPASGRIRRGRNPRTTISLNQGEVTFDKQVPLAERDSLMFRHV